SARHGAPAAHPHVRAGGRGGGPVPQGRRLRGLAHARLPARRARGRARERGVPGALRAEGRGCGVRRLGRHWSGPHRHLQEAPLRHPALPAGQRHEGRDGHGGDAGVPAPWGPSGPGVLRRRVGRHGGEAHRRRGGVDGGLRQDHGPARRRGGRPALLEVHRARPGEVGEEGGLRDRAGLRVRGRRDEGGRPGARAPGVRLRRLARRCSWPAPRLPLPRPATPALPRRLPRPRLRRLRPIPRP
ncbi:unnamed protein product, partial [Prorocentrum cordatum]